MLRKVSTSQLFRQFWVALLPKLWKFAPISLTAILRFAQAYAGAPHRWRPPVRLVQKTHEFFERELYGKFVLSFLTTLTSGSAPETPAQTLHITAFRQIQGCAADEPK
ncbi:MAG: hypothetical protein HRU29_09215 [Rhizobiales bacterium]|nr:hypothetical protein [Hyphomicrobiales bacterium]NRB14567.1 hypothetical protein [Hyphomicrobiales bacterium]